jgi:hypothetical protein
VTSRSPRFIMATVAQRPLPQEDLREGPPPEALRQGCGYCVEHRCAHSRRPTEHHRQGDR